MSTIGDRPVGSLFMSDLKEEATETELSSELLSLMKECNDGDVILCMFKLAN